MSRFSDFIIIIVILKPHNCTFVTIVCLKLYTVCEPLPYVICRHQIISAVE